MIDQTIASGGIPIAFGLAFAAGVIAFASPCVLPLAPGYLSYVTGLTGSELAEGDRSRGRVLAGSLLFVLGFSAVFISYGLIFGGVGAVLLQYQDVINRVLGVVIIVMGLAFMGLIPGMQREWRLHMVPRVGCCRGAAARGALRHRMVAVHRPDAHGRAVPRVHRGQRGPRCAALPRLLPRIGGGMLVLVGILLVSGLWTDFTVWLRVTLPGFETAL